MKNKKWQKGAKSIAHTDSLEKLATYLLFGVVLAVMLVGYIIVSNYFDLYPHQEIPFCVRMLIAPVTILIACVAFYLRFRSRSRGVSRLMPWVVILLAIFFSCSFMIYVG